MAQQVKNPTRIQEDVGLIPGLAPWVKGSSVAVSCGTARILCCCGCDGGWQLQL